MRKSTVPRLVKADRDQILTSLTVGVPTMSVSTENRRQVFVESEYDESCYLELFALMKGRIGSPYSLEFIASGRGGQGNSIAVVRLVTNLRSAGNTSVWGIVDRDSRGGSPAGIVFSTARYSLENMVLDPLALAVYLLRDSPGLATEMGLPSGTRHFDVASAHFQTLVAWIVDKVGMTFANVVPVGHMGGAVVDVPTEWLTMKGHDLEALVVHSFQQLNRHGKGLKLAVAKEALGDRPT